MPVYVGDLSVVRFPSFKDSRGLLGVAELTPTVPFPVRRIFWVNEVPENLARGGHAHKLCHQYFICISGHILVEAHDGQGSEVLVLPAGCGVHIPPGIYASERFVESRSLLIVLCDLPYDKDDYIHSIADFVAFRQRDPC